ncbi:MAG: FtsQ-type POTRA domain-containing protein [Clostridiales bacterium]|jgi:cell division protein FtsQ|nr:FtsQ-type POTRA domain-containing protein [Clostridiales bacterium]
MSEDIKKTARKKKKRRKKYYSLRILIALVVIAGAALFLRSSFFDVDKITVENNYYFSDSEIITMADIQPYCNLFWGIDSGRIISRLTVDPYIEEVSVTRKLPSELVIDVKERKQIAAVIYGDKYVVIDEEGIVLRITETKPKVTLLKGLTLSKVIEGEEIEAEESVSLKNTLKMFGAMEEGDIYFIRIEISDIFIKAYIYNALVCKGTPSQMLNSIENGNLQKILNSLFEKDISRGTINLSEGNYASFTPKVE